MKFKKILKGERITLKKLSPTIPVAKMIFSTIDSQREHLGTFLPWVEGTKKVEDSLFFLHSKEKESKEGKSMLYGIYLINKYIGQIEMFNIDEKNKSGEMGYWLSKDYIRKGYMSEAVKVLEKEFFENHDLNRIVIKCDEDNIASSGVAKKCNYVYEGTQREDNLKPNQKFRNTQIFSKLKSEYFEK